MKYLWSMVVLEKGGRFSFTECTPEREMSGWWSGTGEKSYSPDDPIIKPIFDAAIELCKILGFELDDSDLCKYLLIRREVKSLLVIYGAGAFEVVMKNGEVKVRTENRHSFTKQQFDAFFEFVDLLIKHNWLN
ncbi:MAG: hypothetical protein IJE68_04770 [Clostridia bacterium]|nr:hypothetical protein [Clostridia bacterium]